MVSNRQLRGEVMFNINWKDKKFYNAMLAIALPIALQNLISSSLNMVDTLMIGRIGETEIAAVGLANQYFFLLILVLFGVNSGAAIFTSQYWGKDDIPNIKRVMGIMLIIGGGMSLIFTVAAFFFPQLILRLFTEDMRVIALGSEYLRIVSLSYIITAVSFTYSFTLRSTGQAKLPMVVSAVSLVSNTILNYLLIFGNMGFPQMGVAGAALATLISRVIELLLIMVIVYGQRMEIAATLREMLDIPSTLFLQYIKTGLPVILNEGFWSLGMVMYTVAYARISTEAIASVQISNTIQSVFMVVAFGLGNACAVMLGNAIGAKEEEKALDYAAKFAILGPLVGILLGVMLFMSSGLILSFFNISPEVYMNAKYILMIMSFFISFRIFNTILIIGILRSGGDTTFSLILELCSVWLLGVPIAFIGAILLKLPVYWVVALVSCEEIVKALVGIPRVVSKKWLRSVVDFS